MQKHKYNPNRREIIWGFIFVLPALSLFLMFTYYPFISSFFYSFTDMVALRTEYSFIGLDNFKRIPSDRLVKAGVGNTVKFALFTTLVSNTLNLLLALVLDSSLRIKKFLRVVFYFPCLLSSVIISAIFGNILQFNGVFNELFRILGWNAFVIDYFANIKAALPMLMVLNIWQYCGYGAVIYLAGLQSIPTEYYEAATIDGAGKAGVFFRITLPLLMPSVTIVSFIALTGGMKLFDLPYILTKGGPMNSTETIGTVIYKTAFAQKNLGYATSISLTLFAIIAILSIMQLSFTRNHEAEL